MLLSAFLLTASLPIASPPHDGPDPIGSWRLEPAAIDGSHLAARRGATARIDGAVTWADDGADERSGQSLEYDGRTTRVVVIDDTSRSSQPLPTQHLTVSVWASVTAPQRWGGLLGVIQDNGDAEAGWILGYDDRRFTFGLASEGADDGNGHMTYLPGATDYELGKLYHVVATYDGATMRLYVNGKLDATSTAQSGPVLDPDRASLVIGGYVDRDESGFHQGRIRSVAMYDQCAGPSWVADAFRHDQDLAERPPQIWIDPEQRWVVEPYLQWATQDGMTIRWETSRPSTTVVRCGTAVTWTGPDEARVGSLPVVVERADGVMQHEVQLEGLQPDTAYYYEVASTDDQGRTLTSPFLSFQTACDARTPYAFAVISDTQGNPEVSGRLATLAWAQRPRFLVHPGDLVSTGSVRREWVEEFFRSMKPLLERVPLYPVLGNHEQDARPYYDAMSLPDPEYYYTFAYGNAQFFMLDTNREVGPGSEQYAWLERQLAASTATWKIVVHHHPPYSSDENDYGDRWSGPGTAGDTRVRALVPLYDAHGVDIVWNGHIHSYERTWPLRGGQATTESNGTTYLITGGGGGGLETPGPIRPPFQNLVRRGHHYCLVAVNGPVLEMRAYGLDGELFDHVTIRKASPPAAPGPAGEGPGPSGG